MQNPRKKGKGKKRQILLKKMEWIDFVVGRGWNFRKRKKIQGDSKKI